MVLVTVTLLLIKVIGAHLLSLRNFLSIFLSVSLSFLIIKLKLVKLFQKIYCSIPTFQFPLPPQKQITYYALHQGNDCGNKGVWILQVWSSRNHMGRSVWIKFNINSLVEKQLCHGFTIFANIMQIRTSSLQCFLMQDVPRFINENYNKSSFYFLASSFCLFISAE